MKQKFIMNGSVCVILLCYISCRSTETDNIIRNSQGAASVNINLLGSEFLDASSLPLQASENKQSLAVSQSVQSSSVLLDPSTVVIAELSPSISLKSSALASSVGNSIAVVPGTSLAAGSKYRVIAYRASDGSFQTYQDYTIGEAAKALILDGGTEYNIVSYSYGTVFLPVISAGEQGNIKTATLNYDSGNRDFMYQNSKLTPSVGNNTLNITLGHKIAQINVIVNSTIGNPNVARNITGISNGKLAPDYNDGVYSLSSGTMSGRTALASAGRDVSFPVVSFPSTNIVGESVFINSDTEGNKTGSFTASIAIENEGIKDVKIPLSIRPGYKSNLTINLVKCGAFLGPNDWREFMCHDLGADTSADPFIPSQRIHGAKYQWGANTDETGRYISQSDDQSNSVAISGWISEGKLNSDGWSEYPKATSDPCPSGFRVPVSMDGNAIFNNNIITFIGTNMNSTTNYSSGYKIGNALFVPASGSRNSNNGSLDQRGSSVRYWSSSPLGVGSASAYALMFSSPYRQAVSKTLGLPIRCIKEN